MRYGIYAQVKCTWSRKVEAEAKYSSLVVSLVFTRTFLNAFMNTSLGFTLKTPFKILVSNK